MKNTKDICSAKCPCSDPCPHKEALEIIGGKWKIPILCALLTDGETRFNELKRKIKGITNTMLTSSLKELERDGLVIRTEYLEIPVRVEYNITNKGKNVVPILNALTEWHKTM